MGYWGERFCNCRSSLYRTHQLGHFPDFFYIAAGFLDADDVGVLGKFGDEFGGEVVPGEGWDVVEQDRERGVVGYCAEEGEHVDRLGHLAFVEVRRAD